MTQPPDGDRAAPDWDAIDVELEAGELERLRALRRRHGTVGTALGRVGMGLEEIYEGKPSRQVQEAVAIDETGQGGGDEDPGDVVINIER